MSKTANLQDVFLNTLRRDKVLCTIHLTNGFQIKGRLQSFDNFVLVVITSDGKQMMIYKHALSSVTPNDVIDLKEEMNSDASV